MKANELADYVDKCNAHDDEKLYQAADMLRQQQAEIAALKAKTLTDEEIIAIADDPYLCNKDGSLRSCIEFARAILRKAQEK